jgi:hypothetical protein
MLLLLLATSLLSAASKCVDLSGTYVHAGADNGLWVSIAQTRCERVVMTWGWDTSTPRAPIPLVLDGRFHATSPGFLGFRQMSASLSGSRLTILMTGQVPGDSAKPYKLEFTLLADGDLCHTDHSVERWSRLSRQQGQSRAAEAEAFRRAVLGAVNTLGITRLERFR